MRVLSTKNGPTVVSSKEFNSLINYPMKKVYMSMSLNENELHTAQQLRQRGLVLRVNDNGKAKFKIYPQQK